MIFVYEYGEPREKRRTRRKLCPSVILFTINPTKTEPGANRSLRSDRPTTNLLSHDTVCGGRFTGALCCDSTVQCDLLCKQRYVSVINRGACQHCKRSRKTRLKNMCMSATNSSSLQHFRLVHVPQKKLDS
jgi:hypothetical protein